MPTNLSNYATSRNRRVKTRRIRFPSATTTKVAEARSMSKSRYLSMSARHRFPEQGLGFTISKPPRTRNCHRLS